MTTSLVQTPEIETIAHARDCSLHKPTSHHGLTHWCIEDDSHGPSKVGRLHVPMTDSIAEVFMHARREFGILISPVLSVQVAVSSCQYLPLEGGTLACVRVNILAATRSCRWLLRFKGGDSNNYTEDVEVTCAGL